MRLIDAHSPLHGQALCRATFSRKSVRVHLSLQGLPGCIQLAAVKGESALQAQQCEIVSVDVHGV